MSQALVLIILCAFSREIVYSQSVPKDDPNDNAENRAIMEQNQCVCVLHYLCDNEGYVITDGRGLISERLGSENAIKCKGGNIDGEYLCCKLKNNQTTTQSTTTSIASTITISNDEISTIKVKRRLLCGKPRPSINVRVLTSGELTPLDGEFPWVATIYKWDSYDSKWTYQKMGSLIHPKVILTATHVVYRIKPSDLKVIVNGKIELTPVGEDLYHERNVSEVIKHENYSSGTLDNNIALLILNEPYNKRNKQINTICIRPEIPFDNKRCFVAGWGEATSTSLLKKVEVPIVPRKECEEKVKKLRANFQLYRSFICAGGEEGKDSCTGDGGSPLVCPSGINDTMYQVGIVAYGIGCGRKEVPSFYTNVSYLYDWIVAKLKEREIVLKFEV